MSKHTPGPWMIDPDDGLIVQVDNRDNLGIAIVEPMDRVDGRWNGGEITKANATLIAAAPELLEALTNITALYETDEGCRSLPEYVKARAALSKARGEA